MGEDWGMPRLADYPHFARVAARLQWDEAAIALDGDAAEWTRLGASRRRRIATFVATFLFCEERVAVDLAPFTEAASDPGMERCFRLQARDEERHAAFFARYAREVVRLDAEVAVPVALADLFGTRLRDLAAALGRGQARLGDAVGLYHLVLEGVAFSAGQRALLDELGDGRLPALRFGLERVVADERWHIGFGARVIQDCGLGGGGRDALDRDGAEAASAWESLLSREQRDAAVRLHRRRLRAALRPPNQPEASSDSRTPSTPRATATS
jgi:ribonucleoside-diphosphate reductase beta chain